MQTLFCERLDGDQWVLVADPSLVCGQGGPTVSRHLMILMQSSGAVLAVAICFAFPSVMAFKIRKIIRLDLWEDEEYISKYSNLVHLYKHNFAYFFVFSHIYSEIILGGIGVLLRVSALTMNLVTSISLFIFGMIIVALMPFKERRDCVLALIDLFVAIGMIACSQVAHAACCKFRIAWHTACLNQHDILHIIESLHRSMVVTKAALAQVFLAICRMLHVTLSAIYDQLVLGLHTLHVGSLQIA